MPHAHILYPLILCLYKNKKKETNKKKSTDIEGCVCAGGHVGAWSAVKRKPMAGVGVSKADTAGPRCSLAVRNSEFSGIDFS